MQVIVRNLLGRFRRCYIDTRRDETPEPTSGFPSFRFLGEKREASPKVTGSRAEPRRFVKSAKSRVEGSFYRDRTDHPSPKVTCTVEGSLLCREVMGGLGARFAWNRARAIHWHEYRPTDRLLWWFETCISRARWYTDARSVTIASSMFPAFLFLSLLFLSLSPNVSSPLIFFYVPFFTKRNIRRL